MIFKVIYEAFLASFVELREDIIKKHNRLLAEGSRDDVCLYELKRENNWTGFTARGGAIGGGAIKNKINIITMNTKASVP